MPTLSALPDLSAYRRQCLWAAAVFYALMIGIGSIPGEANELGRFLPDTVLHFTAYGFLSFLLCIGLGPRTGAALVWRVLALIALMGLVDETIQSTLSYRTADIKDWLVDMASAITVTTGFLLAPARR
ncbi:hypothetical protein GCM10023144_29620 [Pigmentiphaga soli]|uniref:VanZ-like domain-containing protein n=1 Tax=Pigmentiphaga soli TaxID=1007095 RepID=A0ABP8H8J1_9BURK